MASPATKACPRGASEPSPLTLMLGKALERCSSDYPFSREGLLGVGPGFHVKVEAEYLYITWKQLVDLKKAV